MRANHARATALQALCLKYIPSSISEFLAQVKVIHPTDQAEIQIVNQIGKAL